MDIRIVLSGLPRPIHSPSASAAPRPLGCNLAGSLRAKGGASWAARFATCSGPSTAGSWRSILGRRLAATTGTPRVTTLPQGTWAPWTAPTPATLNERGFRSVALPVPKGQLRNGVQNILLSADIAMMVQNVNIVLVAAAPVPNPGASTPSNLRIVSH